MNKVNVGLWKHVSKDKKTMYYVGYFLGLRIVLFDNKEAKKKNEKSPDLRLIVSTQSNLNQKLQEVDFDFATDEENSFETEAGAEA